MVAALALVLFALASACAPPSARLSAAEGVLPTRGRGATPAGLLDPSASWTASGLSGGDYFGSALAGGGDVNGDGYADLLVGAPGRGSYAGAAYYFAGGPALPATSADQSWAPYTARALFGSSLSDACDFDGDGYDDVAIAAPQLSGQGKVLIYAGSASGPAASPSTELAQLPDSAFGTRIDCAGDLNGDGYGDLVVGAPLDGRDPGDNNGAAAIYLGGATGLSTPWDTLVQGDLEDKLGNRVAGAGDVNGDGYDDVLIASHYVNDYAGEARLYLGSATGLNGSPAVVWSGEASEDELGAAVAGVGDLNADGYDDIALGVYGVDASRGEVWVCYGGPDGPDSTPDQVLIGDDSVEGIGATLAGVGDLDADGFDDLVIGAGLYVAGQGRVLLYKGGPDGLAEEADEVIEGDASDGNFGAAAAGAGDVDGDGAPDVLLSAPYRDAYAGVAMLLAGEGPVDLDGDGYRGDEDCDEGRADVNAGATESPADGLDSDCDGLERCYADADGDGYRTDDAALLSADLDCSGAGEADASLDAGDCDDGDADVHPGGDDLPGDGVDQDCDGLDASEPHDTAPPEDSDPPADSAPPADTGEPTGAEKDGRGCAVAGGRAGGLGLGLALGIALARRRRGKDGADVALRPASGRRESIRTGDKSL